MRWFGETWGAPVCEPRERTETPTGVPCLLCEEPIGARARGFVLPYVVNCTEAEDRAVHAECFWANVGIPREEWPT